MAVPQPLSNLASLVQEVQRWEWVATNTLELNADKYGREEVSRQRQAATGAVGAPHTAQVGFKQFGERTSLAWFHQGKTLEIKDGRHLLSELSRICDETYTEAPHIHNELVNRRSLSSAAAAARMRLIERMFTDGKSPLLGMNPDKKPPEMSMYLSVLLNTGIHQEHDGTWRIGEPHHRRDEKVPSAPNSQEDSGHRPKPTSNSAGRPQGPFWSDSLPFSETMASPAPAAVLKASPERLRSAGLSRPKASYVLEPRRPSMGT